MRLTNSRFLIIVASLVALLLLPLGLTRVFDPLQPPALALTATLYVSTEAAYSTRTAREEIEATSVFEIIPLDEYGNPIEPTQMEQPLSDAFEGEIVLVGQINTPTPTATLLVTATPMPPTYTPTSLPIPGSSSLELNLFSCHLPTDRLDRTLQPNEPFSVLGWNVDGDGMTYFLIEDDPTQQQVWIQVDVSVVLMTDYKASFPKATSCRTWVVTPNASTAAARSTAENIGTPIPLPQIKTATPLPPSPFEQVLTEADAAQQITEDVPELKNPEVTFTLSEVRVKGGVEAAGPLGVRVGGTVEVVGTLRIENKKLVMDVSSVTLNGSDITQNPEGQNASASINNWLRGLLVQREITSFELGEDQLTLVGVELHESVFPTLIGTASPTVDPTLLGTQTGTPPATVSLPQARSVTFTPVVAPASDITSEVASTEAHTSLTAVQHAEISFLADRVVIKGLVKLPTQAISQTLVLEGPLSVRNERIVLDATVFTLDGVAAASTDDGTRLLAEINAWWPQLTKGQRIVSVQLTNGVLKINP